MISNLEDYILSPHDTIVLLGDVATKRVIDVAIKQYDDEGRLRPGVKSALDNLRSYGEAMVMDDDGTVRLANEADILSPNGAKPALSLEFERSLQAHLRAMQKNPTDETDPDFIAAWEIFKEIVKAIEDARASSPRDEY